MMLARAIRRPLQVRIGYRSMDASVNEKGIE
jgi:hypothetical protein